MTVTNLTVRHLAAVRLALNATVDSTTRALALAWSGAWDEVTDAWRVAIDDLIASSDGGWPTRTQILRAERTTRALKETLARMKALGTAAGVTVTGELGDLVAITDEWERALAGSQLPAAFDLSWTRVDGRTLDAIVQRTTGHLESRMHPLPADQQATMKQVLIRGVAIGDNPKTAATIMLKRLHGAFDGGLRRAQVISRTEMLDAHRAAADAARKANADLLTGWMWTATKSHRTCPSCMALDGRIFPLDQPGPHDHPCGRCTAVPVTKTYRDLGIAAPEPPADYQSGREWFDQQPRAVQLSIMGAERLARLDRGEIDWDSMAVLVDNPDWRPSWQVRPLAA